MGETEIPSSLEDLHHLDHIMVLTTARTERTAVTRLPDRTDRGRTVGAVQVQSAEQAETILSYLDRDGRVIYVDVERKQSLNMMAVATHCVRSAKVQQIKPNDLTVEALTALVIDRRGSDLSDQKISIFGTGNLAFKFALRLSESGAAVFIGGRDAAKAETLAATINLIAPPFSDKAVVAEAGQDINVFVSCVSAEHVIDGAWLDKFAPGALCVDAGIDNFSPQFIERALSLGHNCVRLDVRSAGDPLPLYPNPFFESISGQRTLLGTRIVAGGVIGRRGDLVVDRVDQPGSVIGVANGTGSLLARADWSQVEAEAVSRLTRAFAEEHERHISEGPSR